MTAANKQFILLALACLQVSACLATVDLDVANYTLRQSRADFDHLNRWLSKTVNNGDPEENLRQAIDKLHRIGEDQLGLKKAILIMKELAEMDQCNEDTVGLLKVISGATGAVAGVIRRVDTVLRHFARRAAAKCQLYLDQKLVELSKSFRVNSLEALKPATGRASNLALSLAKHDGRFKPNGKELADLLRQLAAGDERNVYYEKKPKGDYVYHYGNLEYTYGRYLSGPCKEYTRRLANTIGLIKPVLLFASDERSGEDFFARRSQDFQLALFRYQACEDIMRKTVDLGDIFDALVY